MNANINNFSTQPVNYVLYNNYRPLMTSEESLLDYPKEIFLMLKLQLQDGQGQKSTLTNTEYEAG